MLWHRAQERWDQGQDVTPSTTTLETKTGRRLPEWVSTTINIRVLLMCLIKGVSLHWKLFSAAMDMAEHTISHNELSSTFSKEILVSWTNQVKAWESDPTQLNPFEAIVQGMSYKCYIQIHISNSCL